MSDRVTVYLDIETENGLAELQDFSNKVDELGRKWQKVKMLIRTEGTKILHSITSIISLFKQVLKAANISIGHVGDAILMAVEALVSTLLVVYTSYSALSMTNPIFLISAGIAFSSLLIAMDSSIKTAAGVEDSKRMANEAMGMMSSLRGIFTPWG